jgi:hypothetical protein
MGVESVVYRKEWHQAALPEERGTRTNASCPERLKSPPGSLKIFSPCMLQKRHCHVAA